MSAGDVVVQPQGDSTRWMFWCPACQFAHAYDSRWTFNGNTQRPTFAPSLRNTWEAEGRVTKCCHLFVRDGQIEYCGDCTHEMKGQTVPMVPWEWHNV